MKNLRLVAWHWVVSALPLGVTALLYLWPVYIDEGQFIPGTSLQSLGHIMQVEWLVIVSGLLLAGPLALFPKTRWGRRIQMFIFCGIAAAFVSAASTINGVESSFAFVALVYFTYGGNALVIPDANIRRVIIPLALARWMVNLTLLIACMMVTDMPARIESWDGRAITLTLGARFFSALFLSELLVFSWLSLRAQQYIDRVRQSLTVFQGRINERADERAQQYRRLYGIRKK